MSSSSRKQIIFPEDALIPRESLLPKLSSNVYMFTAPEFMRKESILSSTKFFTTTISISTPGFT